jgi:hypothetical protein
VTDLGQCVPDAMRIIHPMLDKAQSDYHQWEFSSSALIYYKSMQSNRNILTKWVKPKIEADPAFVQEYRRESTEKTNTEVCQNEKVKGLVSSRLPCYPETQMEVGLKSWMSMTFSKNVLQSFSLGYSMTKLTLQ